MKCGFITAPILVSTNPRLLVLVHIGTTRLRFRDPRTAIGCYRLWDRAQSGVLNVRLKISVIGPSRRWYKSMAVGNKIEHRTIGNDLLWSRHYHPITPTVDAGMSTILPTAQATMTMAIRLPSCRTARTLQITRTWVTLPLYCSRSPAQFGAARILSTSGTGSVISRPMPVVAPTMCRTIGGGILRILLLHSIHRRHAQDRFFYHWCKSEPVANLVQNYVSHHILSVLDSQHPGANWELGWTNRSSVTQAASYKAAKWLQVQTAKPDGCVDRQGNMSGSWLRIT